ncbi:uncharacterized protein LOC116213257 [Punica granatum]|uniref:DUF7392 domain-containing protein n=2 Tax=Punica granatum TaxID=22663 RepID=A0A218VTH1_PUNGR|nr:uncharacterized protein LOC116213257 [Punica granatum]OWM63847.1 hypothetical protein CDL15_Pgr006109 [Punica granatum]PKI68071.1 hypothetical protein CRG98_011667 [Punica granatum]
MACFVPFNNRNLDVSFFVFRPTLVIVDEFFDALKRFSACTESLGCVQSSIFTSIHGNMIIWYGAWMKKSSENKESLNATLLSMLKSTSSMAVIVEHSFFNPYAGESRDGSSAAKFFTGDIISVNAAESIAADSYPDESRSDDLSFACLAIFKSQFSKTEGVKSGACLRSQSRPRVACLYIWKSLHCCYSCILSTDYRRSMIPYCDQLSIEVKYDLFRVVFVSTEIGSGKYNDQLYYAAHDRVLGHGDEESNERGAMQI